MVFTSNQDKTAYYINGLTFDPARVDAVAQLGTTEEWTIENPDNSDHPFHLHTNPSQITSVLMKHRL